MLRREDFAGIKFHPVVKLPDEAVVFDFTQGYNRREVRSAVWGVGRYHEVRKNMYTAPQYANRRNIHMGIDLWAPARTPVYTAWRGVVVHQADHHQPGNYGPTIVLKHRIASELFYALHGHLTRDSLEHNPVGKVLQQGVPFAEIGEIDENGYWEPHLHYQISPRDPGEADMPGVVAPEDLDEALKLYPDPRLILGNLY